MKGRSQELARNSLPSVRQKLPPLHTSSLDPQEPQRIVGRGTWLVQWVEHPASAWVMITVCEFEPHIRLSISTEPTLDPRSPPLCPSLPPSLKINTKKKKKRKEKKCPEVLQKPAETPVALSPATVQRPHQARVWNNDISNSDSN